MQNVVDLLYFIIRFLCSIVRFVRDILHFL